MLKKILSELGKNAFSSVSQKEGPYSDKSANFVYQLLFCDRPDLYKPTGHDSAQGPWPILFGKRPDHGAIARIAADVSQESRVRALACHLLREAGVEVPKKQWFGTIIEVRLPEGLDTLAVFADGGVRYINHTGKMTIVEGTENPFGPEIQKVIAASRPLVDAIGPWDRERLAAPVEGNIRVSFLASDGLYFGEGPMDAMMQDALAAPMIGASTSLLMKIVEKSTGRGH